MGADMNISFRSKIDQLGRKGKVAEGKILRTAGEAMAKEIASNINRSSKHHEHLQDNIKVSNVKTNKFGERSVHVGAKKELGYRLKFLEFGTSKMSAQAPLTRGVEQSKDAVARILIDGQRRIMKL